MARQLQAFDPHVTYSGRDAQTAHFAAQVRDALQKLLWNLLDPIEAGYNWPTVAGSTWIDVANVAGTYTVSHNDPQAEASNEPGCAVGATGTTITVTPRNVSFDGKGHKRAAADGTPVTFAAPPTTPPTPTETPTTPGNTYIVYVYNGTNYVPIYATWQTVLTHAELVSGPTLRFTRKDVLVLGVSDVADLDFALFDCDGV